MVMPGVSVTTLARFVSIQPATRQARMVHWRTALSNVDNPTYAAGFGVTCQDSKGMPVMLLCDPYRLDRDNVHPVDCGYLLDDGDDVQPYYVAGWCLFDRSRPVGSVCDVDLPAGYLRLRRQQPMAPHGARGPRRTWHLSISPLGTD